ncbi:MAG: hypothetical protein ACI965_001108 [Paraglaciecola sp.]|jgi:hypothetical protein
MVNLVDPIIGQQLTLSHLTKLVERTPWVSINLFVVNMAQMLKYTF